MKEQQFPMTAALDMLYLCTCVLCGETPRQERLAAIDLKALYAVSKFHSLTALVCEGLSTYPATSETKEDLSAFQRAKALSVRKNMLMDLAREELFAFFEGQGIWYMPLKGVLLKDLYPKMGLRQMSDNDILFDADFRPQVRDWFVDQGYSVESYEAHVHDTYHKLPIYNFELHVALYGAGHYEWYQTYYENVKDRLLRDEGKGYGYHFTDEDFYIHVVSHGFRHFDSKGTGLRLLLDFYVYLQAKGAAMDMDYVERELQTLRIADFHRDCLALMEPMFSNPHDFSMEALPPAQQDLLGYFLTCGTYGTMENHVKRQTQSMGKGKFFLSRLFPGPEIMKVYHPIFGKHKWLLPLGWVYRFFRQWSRYAPRLWKELTIALRVEKK